MADSPKKQSFNIIDSFKKNFEDTTGISTDDFLKAQKLKREVSAKTGNNARFQKVDKWDSSNEMDEEYANVLKDALGYYKKEFNITPRATINSDWIELGDESVSGLTELNPNGFGQYSVNLRGIPSWQHESEIEDATESEKHGWWPKGSGGNLSSVPVHEFGHVLTAQLLPEEDNVSKLLDDSFKDMGINYKSSKERLKAINEAKKVSGYGGQSYIEPITRPGEEDNPSTWSYTPKSPVIDPYETIAEALTDYYYNRDNAAKLSKTIVKRLKNKGYTYGLEQAGGVAKPDETFLQNLRRYSAIQ